MQDFIKVLKCHPNNLKIYQTENLFITNLTPESNPHLELVQKSNGTIYDNETNDVVCMGAPIILEYDFEEKLSDIIGIQKIVDGVFIRLYYYNDKWNTATKKYIDAHNSYWGSKKSFGELWDEINYDTSSLNPQYNYFFIMQHKDFRNFVKFKENKIYMVDKYNLVEKKFERCFNEKLSIDDVKNKHESYIIKTNTLYYSSLSEKFNKIKDIKRNMKSHKYMCIVNLKYNKKNEFIEYFPEHQNLLINVEKQLFEISVKIHTKYIEKYIYKIEQQIDKNIYYVVRHLHDLYLKTGQKTTLDVVQQQIMRYSPKRIFKLIKE